TELRGHACPLALYSFHEGLVETQREWQKAQGNEPFAEKNVWRNCGDLAASTRKGLRRIDVNPYMAKCRREDSNLHSLNGNQVVNLARLPVPPLRQVRLSES